MNNLIDCWATIKYITHPLPCKMPKVRSAAKFQQTGNFQYCGLGEVVIDCEGERFFWYLCDRERIRSKWKRINTFFIFSTHIGRWGLRAKWRNFWFSPMDGDASRMKVWLHFFHVLSQDPEITFKMAHPMHSCPQPILLRSKHEKATMLYIWWPEFKKWLLRIKNIEERYRCSSFSKTWVIFTQFALLSVPVSWLTFSKMIHVS